VAGLFGLLAMPPVLIVFSYVVQPVLMPRYAIVAALGFAAAAAWLLAQARQQAAILASVFLLVFGSWQMALYADLVQQEDEQRQRLFAVLRAHTERAPVVFESRLDLYPVRHYAADLWARSSLLDFEDGQIRGFAPKRIVERDVGRCFAEQYPEQFRLTRFSDLSRLGRFFLVVLPDKTSAGPDYDGFQVRPVGERVFELTAKRPAGGPLSDPPPGNDKPARQRSVSQDNYSAGNQ
jgi:hypothetical protein